MSQQASVGITGQRARAPRALRLASSGYLSMEHAPLRRKVKGRWGPPASPPAFFTWSSSAAWPVSPNFSSSRCNGI